MERVHLALPSLALREGELPTPMPMPLPRQAKNYLPKTKNGVAFTLTS